MDRTSLFQVLLDVLFVFQVFALLSLFIILPIGETKITMVNIGIEKWGFAFWATFVISLFSFFSFIVGVWYLRKVGRQLLGNYYFKPDTIRNLKRSGNYLILSGAAGLIISIIGVLLKLFLGEIKLTYESSTVLNLFMLIVGLFFVIQSGVLKSAKKFKEENDLTI